MKTSEALLGTEDPGWAVVQDWLVMNIFELSAIASPVAGAIAGATVVKVRDAAELTLGMGAGLGVGLTLYSAAMGVTCVLARFCTSRKLSGLQWLASVAAVLLPAAAPFAAWVLSVAVVNVMHL